jgi:hypothetical protein
MSSTEIDRAPLYATWLRDHGDQDDIAGTVAAFRATFPDAGLAFPDLGAALLAADPLGILRHALALRTAESAQRHAAIQEQTAAHARLDAARASLLRRSRAALHASEQALDDALWTALGRCLADAPTHQTLASYHQTVVAIAGGLRPESIGSDGRWCGEGPDTTDVQFLLDRRRNKTTWEDDDLLVNEGGIYAHCAAGPLRRDHAGKLVASDAVLLGRALRYRGCGRRNESKGIRQEEGWRRTLGQVLCGDRAGLNTRSRAALADVILPWCAQIRTQRVRRMLKAHWPQADDQVVTWAADALAATGIFTPPEDLIGRQRTPTGASWMAGCQAVLRLRAALPQRHAIPA